MILRGLIKEVENKDRRSERNIFFSTFLFLFQVVNFPFLKLGYLQQMFYDGG